MRVRTSLRRDLHLPVHSAHALAWRTGSEVAAPVWGAPAPSLAVREVPGSEAGALLAQFRGVLAGGCVDAVWDALEAAPEFHAAAACRRCMCGSPQRVWASPLRRGKQQVHRMPRMCLARCAASPRSAARRSRNNHLGRPQVDPSWGAGCAATWVYCSYGAGGPASPRGARSSVRHVLFQRAGSAAAAL